MNRTTGQLVRKTTEEPIPKAVVYDEATNLLPPLPPPDPVPTSEPVPQRGGRRPMSGRLSDEEVAWLKEMEKKIEQEALAKDDTKHAEKEPIPKAVVYEEATNLQPPLPPPDSEPVPEHRGVPYSSNSDSEKRRTRRNKRKELTDKNDTQHTKKD